MMQSLITNYCALWHKYKKTVFKAAKLLIIIFLVFLLLSCLGPKPSKHITTFLDNVCIIPHEKYNYLTCESTELLVDGRPLTIPQYFHTDLASIPRFYWFIMSPRYSGFVAPSILHDFMYRCSTHYQKSDIDGIFYWALRQNGISQYTAYKMYLAVKIFGTSSYNPNINCKYGLKNARSTQIYQSSRGI